MNWVLIGTLFVVALVACCMGFARFVWFMSIGYGLAVAAIALACLVAGAGITGNPANLLVIDDPIKNREEADCLLHLTPVITEIPAKEHL